MELKKLETKQAGKKGAVLVGLIEWHAAKKEGVTNTLLIAERRTWKLSQPDGRKTVLDARSELTAMRDLTLGGDLQHSGFHFRAAAEVGERNRETSYLWEPDLPGPGGKVASTNLQWARLFFPISNHWHSATLISHPANPIKELSWRDYGRFGFFFDRTLKSGETLVLNFRVITQPAEAPGTSAKYSPEKLKAYREEANQAAADYRRLDLSRQEQ